MKMNDVIAAGKDNASSLLAVLMLGLFLPLLLYFVLPAMNVNSFGDSLSMDAIFKLVFGLVGGSIFLYITYLGATRYYVAPVCALFLYQTMYRGIDLYLPFIHMNFRALMLAFSLPVLVVMLFKYRYKHNLIKPFIPVFLFFLINVIYTVVGFAQAPNSVYNPELYTMSPNTLIPRSFELELTIYLTFLVIAIYLACHIFFFQREKALARFNQFIVTFLFGMSFWCVAMYFLNDPRLLNLLNGVKRLAGFSAGANGYAFLSGCMLLYVMRVLINNEAGRSMAFRTLCILSIAAGSIGTLLSYSRVNNIILIMFIIFNIVFLSKNKIKSFMNLAMVALGGLLVLGLLQALGSIDLMDTITERLADDGSSEFRPRTWEYLYSQLQWDWHLFFGQGIGGVSSTLFKYFATRYFFNDQQIIYHPHNAFFHVFFDYGIFGFLCYYGTLFWLLIYGAKNLYVNGKLNMSSLFLIELLLYAMVSSTVDTYLFNTETIPFWVIATILYTQIAADKKEVEVHAIQ